MGWMLRMRWVYVSPYSIPHQEIYIHGKNSEILLLRPPQFSFIGIHSAGRYMYIFFDATFQDQGI